MRRRAAARPSWFAEGATKRPPDDGSSRRGTGRSAARRPVAVVAFVVLALACTAACGAEGSARAVSEPSAPSGGAESTTPAGSSDSASDDEAEEQPQPGDQDLPSTDAGGSPEIGDEFVGACTIAWPTAPQRTSQGTQLRTTCPGVDTGSHQFVDILVLDPDLDVSPSRATVEVRGEVVDVLESEYGFTILAVVADEATVR